MVQGRPPIDNPREVFIHTRHTPEEKARWQKLAKSQGMSLTELIREAMSRYVADLKKQNK